MLMPREVGVSRQWIGLTQLALTGCSYSRAIFEETSAMTMVSDTNRPAAAAVDPDTSTPTNANPARTAKKRGVPWPLINFWLDSALLVAFLALIWMSLIVYFIFPSTTTAAGWSLWGLTLDHWMGVQFALIGVLTFGILVHVMFHWSWVCGVFFSRIWKRERSAMPDDGTRTIYGVGLMIVILHVVGGALALAALFVESPL